MSPSGAGSSEAWWPQIIYTKTHYFAARMVRVLAPHLLWPADHRWFAATDVDSDFTSVGGSRGPIDAVITDPKLDTERVYRN